jgi:hypothetical protein
VVALAHVGDELEEVAAVRVVAEDRGPLVAPSRQVLDAVQDLETRRPLHYVTLAGSRPSPRLVDALLHIRHRCNKRDLTSVALFGHEDAKLTTFAAGYSHNRARDEGLPWVQLELERVAGRPVAQARLLQTSDALPEVWEIASGLGHEVEESYWHEFSPMGRGADASSLTKRLNR